MDIELREALREIRDDIKELLPLKQDVERHELLLYGNGHDGILNTIESLKTTHKFYNKILGAIGVIITFVTGNVIWRWLGGKA